MNTPFEVFIESRAHKGVLTELRGPHLLFIFSNSNSNSKVFIYQLPNALISVNPKVEEECNDSGNISLPGPWHTSICHIATTQLLLKSNSESILKWVLN